MNEYIQKEEKTYVAKVDSVNPDTDNNSSTFDIVDENNEEVQKKIHIVSGDGKDLNISDVSEYIEVEKPKEEKKGNIIIPEEKK